MILSAPHSIIEQNGVARIDKGVTESYFEVSLFGKKALEVSFNAGTSPIPILETSDLLGTTSDGTVSTVDHPDDHNSELLTSHNEPLPFSSLFFDSGWLLQLARHPHLFDNADFPGPGDQQLAPYHDQPPSTNNTDSFNPDYSFPLQAPFECFERHSCGLLSYYDHRGKHEPNPSATQNMQSLSLFFPDQSVHFKGIHSSTDPSSAIDSSSSTAAQAGANLSGGDWKEYVSTPATIEAAYNRRKSSNKKLFFCPHCGRNFTANHNLKQSTLANGVIVASLHLMLNSALRGVKLWKRYFVISEF
ncbi:hypothetical protein K435DRAFT_809112 [Dendrothele bispora CBS 962.96]|uniref:C2H2-type domain-containing protein n=1 Tax=Dendrothele bispora (strain CBS 962.96) TaxID=1314807 RepID=A0A4S8KZ65_DENBC|nr:hypothetical protein K435DRAFT_809112 [Dendrothele bispora CBS 962.96]